MGQTCGCGADTEMDRGQVNLDSKVSGKVQRGGVRRPENQEPSDKEVIAIQAAARGAAERRRLKANGGPKLQKMLVADSCLEFKEEIILSDGSVYSGQVRKTDSVRMGYGI